MSKNSGGNGQGKAGVARRDFMRHSAVAATAAVSAPALGARVGSDTFRVALAGCGKRGTGAAHDFMLGAEGVELIGLCDVFPDKLADAKKQLTDPAFYDKRWDKVKNKVKIDPELCFTGFDSCAKMLKTDVDIVILATPPGFRPEYLRMCIDAGKHVFMEKPACVDAVGARSIMETAALAEKKGLAIVAGTQQRRMGQYIDIMDRVHNGQIGNLVSAFAYWHWDHADWHFAHRQPQWSDMEWQIRCWPYFTWLSGDHIVEQHVHNLDTINWAMGGPPIECLGRGGRQARGGIEHGNIFDHFAIEYVYANGARVSSMSSQIEGATGRVGTRLIGTNGTAWLDRGRGYIDGPNAYKYEGPITSGLEEEHRDLVDSIRAGKPLNEARSVAESTLTAIMGRMSAYTGRQLKYDWVLKVSQEDLRPAKYELGDIPIGPIAVPGKTRLV